jgi:hypothetical protein
MAKASNVIPAKAGIIQSEPAGFTARMRVSMKTTGDAGRQLRFEAVPLDKGGDNPNANWAKRTPRAALELTITQPAEFDRFEHDAEFDVVFVPRTKPANS